VSDRKVRVVVWTPCSVMAVLGCGGILLLWFLATCTAVVVGRSEQKVPPAAAGRR